MRIIPSIKTREVVGIEFAETRLKLAHIRILPYRTELVDLQVIPMSGKKDDQLARDIRAARERFRAPHAECITLISARQVITKNIEIPSEDPQEIREIINLQAGRHTPYSRDEIIADYINLGTYKHSYSKVLLIIVSRGLIKRSTDILHQAGVYLHRVVFAPEGMAIFGQKNLKVETHGAAPFVITDVDENSTDFLVVYRQRALFSRSIPLGCQEILADKEKYSQRFAEEVKRSLEAYQNEDIEKKPVALALMGSSLVSDTLKSALESTVSMQVTTPPCCRSLTVLPEAQKVHDAQERVSFFALVSCVCAAEEMRVDLTSEEVKMRKAVEQRGRELMKTGILILVLVILVSSLFLSRIFFRNMYLHRLTQRYDALAGEVSELEGDFESISLIRNYLMHRGHSVRVLAALHDVAPLELKLTDIRYEEDGRLRVRGSADSMSTVFSFSENMEKSAFFHGVRTRNTLKRKEDDKEVTDFEIEASMDEEQFG